MRFAASAAMPIRRSRFRASDESVPDEPDRLDVLRPDVHRHVGFGLGAHFCVGANVARAELQEALSVVLERCPVIEAVTERPVWQPYAAARRFESLSMRFEVAPRRA